MNNRAKTACKMLSLMTVMVCSFVGVGFVSGAEIFEFFARFGLFFYVGIAVFAFLCVVLCYKILIKTETNIKLQKTTQISNKNTILCKNKTYHVIVFLNVVMISAAMFAGLKILLINLCYNNYWLMLFLCFFVAFVLTVIGVRGLDKVDILVVVFVVGLCVMFVSAGCFNSEALFAKGINGGFLEGATVPAKCALMFFGAVISACLYVFMNILQFQPLASSSGIVFGKRKAVVFSVVFGGVLGIALLIFVLFFRGHMEIAGEPMPFFAYFAARGGVAEVIFAVGMLFCLLTTLVTCLIGTKQIIAEKYKLGRFEASSIAVALALVLSIFPFKFFIAVVYPILGALNFVAFVFC